jgi:hypothetical protein
LLGRLDTGKENDIILVSLVTNAPSASAYLRDERRQTVMMSRARCALIVIGRRVSFEATAEWQRALGTFRAASKWSEPACYQLHLQDVQHAQSVTDNDGGGDEDDSEQQWYAVEHLRDLQQFVARSERLIAKRASAPLLPATPPLPTTQPSLDSSQDAIALALDSLSLRSSTTSTASTPDAVNDDKQDDSEQVDRLCEALGAVSVVKK